MLWRKMRRDLWENKAAYFACVVVIAIGLMVFTSVSVVFESLLNARNNFYEDYNFADGFVRVRSISQSQIDRLAEVEGVAAIDGRFVRDARVMFAEREENVFLRFVSFRPGQTDRLNNIHITEGQLPPERARAVLLDPGFIEANNLRIGDNVPVIIAGNRVDLKISGAGQSPEFVYAMRTVMDVYPDPATFGVAFIPLDVMQTLFAVDTLNDIVFTVAEGYHYDDVESRLKPRLERYGLETLYPREDQVSEVILEQELAQMESMVSAMPFLFLAVASVILYILLKRMVEQQRGQIGTLKAFGYSNRAILLHFISYALVIGSIGGALGGLAGIWLSFPLIQVYQMFFNLPGLTGSFSVSYFIIGVLLSVSFSGVAGYLGSKSAIKLQPAEAMRPPAPPLAGKTLLEHWGLYWRSLTVQGKMATRNLFRSKARSLFTLLGVMFSFSLIATTGYFATILDVVLIDQFVKVQKHDVKIVFNSPLPAQDALGEAARLPGVNRVEPFLEVPAILHNKAFEKGAVILGIQQDSDLYSILQDDGRKVVPPSNGVLLSQRLAELLEADFGTLLEVESPYAANSPFTINVVGVVPQYLGINAYMEISALGRILQQGQIATSLLLSVEENVPLQIKNRYSESSAVFSVEEKGVMLNKFNEMMESFGFMVWILALFGLLTGFAVIYNSGIVSLSERSRELASLRVLGMSPKEVLQVLTFEQWFISFFGMLAGVPLTMALIQGMANTTDSDLFTFPVKFELQPMVIGALGTTAAIWLTHRVIASKIRRLSMVEVLKERD